MVRGKFCEQRRKKKNKDQILPEFQHAKREDSENEAPKINPVLPSGKVDFPRA